MGRIVSNFFISLDGVVERPDQWHFPYFDDAMGEIVGAGMSTTSAFLMGRKLYGEWSEYWPQQGPEVPFSEFINGIPKYVLSTTLQNASWNNTTLVQREAVLFLRLIFGHPRLVNVLPAGNDAVGFLLNGPTGRRDRPP